MSHDIRKDSIYNRKRRLLCGEENHAIRAVSFKPHNLIPRDDLHTLQQQILWMPAVTAATTIAIAY